MLRQFGKKRGLGSWSLPDHFDAILTSEFVGHATETRGGILPMAISKETIFVSSRLQGKGCSPYSILILLHDVRMSIPTIELPYQVDLLCIRRGEFELNLSCQNLPLYFILSCRYLSCHNNSSFDKGDDQMI